MSSYTTNFALLESDPSEPNLDSFGLAFALDLPLEANNKNAIVENAFALGAHVTKQDAFAIYRTALALGISAPELNSFCDIKFQDKTLTIKK